MEVRSSAANLSVNGKHSWDNEYEYHGQNFAFRSPQQKGRETKTEHLRIRGCSGWRAWAHIATSEDYR